MDDQQVLEVAIRAVLEGGKVARELIGDPGYRRWKGLRSLVVGGALQVQARVMEIIRAEFPDHALLAEEDSEQSALGEGPTWILDPIDGSVNFAQGIPFFSLSLAWREAPTSYRVGVVYDPLRDELFQATAGTGAKLNGEPIVVAQFSEGIEAFENAVVGTDWPYSLERRQEAFLIARLIGSETISLPTLGSPALGLCYVACGRLHAYYHLELELWDVAAAAVVLAEAGALFTSASGGSWMFSDGGYVASNGVIHGWVSRPIQSVLRLRERGAGRAAAAEGRGGEPGAG